MFRRILKSLRAITPITSLVLALTIGVIASFAHHSSVNTETTSAIALFTDAVSPESPRLAAARKAAKSGDRELALHDYLASIQEDLTTADAAIGELAEVFLTAAQTAGRDERYVDASAEIKRCYQTLNQLRQADSSSNALLQPARERLFREIARVRAVGQERATAHVRAADQLRREARASTGGAMTMKTNRRKFSTT